jgi:hypothetical protein
MLDDNKIYVCHCGCSFKRDELITTHNCHIVRCPQHDARVKYVVTHCIDCEQEMTITIRQTTTKRCHACNVEHNKRVKARKYLENSSAKTKSEESLAKQRRLYHETKEFLTLDDVMPYWSGGEVKWGRKHV